MSNSGNKPEIRVAMYISSFFPEPMGGMEMQGLRLAQELSKRGIGVTIFTHGAHGSVKKDVYEGISVVRLYSWMNRCLDFFRYLKSKLSFTHKRTNLSGRIKTSGSIPYDVTDTGMSINGNFTDLIYYVIQVINFSRHIVRGGEKYQLIHVHGVPWVSFVGAMAGRICRLPVLVKESTATGLKKYDDIILGRRLRGFVVKHVHFVAISTYINTMIQQYNVRPEHIHYIPNGVYLPAGPMPETSLHPVVLFVGNLTQRAAKGLDVLLQAWPAVINKHPQAKLLIAGNNPDKDEWLAYISGLHIQESVSFLGKTNQMAELYQKATIYVSPSRREGLSNALLEAMAYGLPCVATNISGSQDMIEDGVNGYLVEPDDIPGLTEAILRMLQNNNLRIAMRRNAHEKIRQVCSFEKITEEYEILYKNLVKPDHIKIKNTRSRATGKSDKIPVENN